PPPVGVAGQAVDEVALSLDQVVAAIAVDVACGQEDTPLVAAVEVLLERVGDRGGEGGEVGGGAGACGAGEGEDADVGRGAGAGGADGEFVLAVAVEVACGDADGVEGGDGGPKGGGQADLVAGEVLEVPGGDVVAELAVAVDVLDDADGLGLPGEDGAEDQ